MKSKLLTLFFFSLSITLAQGQNNTVEGKYRIDITAPQCADSLAYLVAYLNGQMYAQDSVRLSSAGKGVLAQNRELPQGQYMIYIKPDIQLDMLIGNKKQDNIRLVVDKKHFDKSNISGSKDSELLWLYAKFLDNKNQEKAALEQELQAPDIAQTKIEDLNKKIAAIDNAVEANLKQNIAKHSKTWFGKYIKGTVPIALPYAQPTSEAEATINRRYGKEHFFDNIDLSDMRMWRTNYLLQYINTYMEQWVEQQADSIANAACKLVAKSQQNDDTFKEMLSLHVNKATASKVMGMESVWAKLAEEYIFDKNIAWIDSVQQYQLRADYEKIKNNRIGMPAHNLSLIGINGEIINTNKIEAKHLLLYFYSDDCGHCLKETPALHNGLYEKYKDKGLKVVAININNGGDKWKNFVSDHKLYDWINASDPAFQSQYWMYFDTSGIPATYLLDENKKIIARKLDEENLARYFEYYIH